MKLLAYHSLLLSSKERYHFIRNVALFLETEQEKRNRNINLDPGKYKKWWNWKEEYKNYFRTIGPIPNTYDLDFIIGNTHGFSSVLRGEGNTGGKKFKKYGNDDYEVLRFAINSTYHVNDVPRRGEGRLLVPISSYYLVKFHTSILQN